MGMISGKCKVMENFLACGSKILIFNKKLFTVHFTLFTCVPLN